MQIITPTSWADIKLVDYLKWYRAVKPYENTEQYFDKAVINAIEYFTNVSGDEYIKMPAKDVTDAQIALAQLLQSIETNQLVKTFDIEGVKYGFIPSFDNISYGEYLDLISYTKNVWGEVPTIMSILYRPIIKSGRTYTIEEYNGTNEDRIELLNYYLTMDVVFGAFSFFLHLQRDLVIGTQHYLKSLLSQMDKEGSVMNKALIKNGVDTTQLQSLQEMISQNLTSLQPFPFTNA